MRFTRYQIGNDTPTNGWLLEDRIGPVEGNLFGEYRRLEANIPLERVRMLAPVEPGKIICVGLNYQSHVNEMERNIPEIPVIFLKAPSSVIGPGSAIILPPQSKQVEHEAELAVIIGHQGRWIKPEDVSKYIFGYTIANDVTARDLQRQDGQWDRSKGFDTFCPLGPWIETEFDPTDVLLTCRVNNELRQMTSTNEMIFTVGQLVSFISSVMTLYPGDVVMTGTPAGVGPLAAGDVVTVSIEGIGDLNNPIALS
jgi:2-keto-4-pentenoate hydratase/2-oxohepta-3-ene-1,7-dioic acid hydratase in catechol pathway